MLKNCLEKFSNSLFFKFGAFAGLIQLIIICYTMPMLYVEPAFIFLIGAAWFKFSVGCLCISSILLIFLKWTHEKKKHKFTKITDTICWILFTINIIMTIITIRILITVY